MWKPLSREQAELSTHRPGHLCPHGGGIQAFLGKNGWSEISILMIPRNRGVIEGFLFKLDAQLALSKSPKLM